jgi:DNA-binding phage protein
MPTAAEALRHCRRAGIDLLAVFKAFHAPTAKVLREPDAASTAAWLRAFVGGQKQQQIAQSTGLSRFSVGRILSGECEPRLPQFLALVQALTFRVEDFVDAWVGAQAVPLLTARYMRMRAAREALFEQPLCLAVMCLLDTRALARPVEEQVRELARVLDRSRPQVRRAIAMLTRGGVLSAEQGRYRLTGSLVLDATSNAERERAARMHWAKVASQRLRRPSESDLFSYNVFSIGRDDFPKLQELQRAFFRSARALIAGSEPTDLAGLLVVHSFAWDPSDG